MSYKTNKRKRKQWLKENREQLVAEREARIKANMPTKKVKKEFTPLKPRESKFVETEEMKRIKAIPSLSMQPKPQIRVKDSHVDQDDWSEERRAEWRQRERAAQKEIARKRTMVAPMYNKGGYQYVGDVPPEIVKTLGRKV